MEATPNRIGFDTEFTRRSTFKPIPELLQLATPSGIALLDLRANLPLDCLADWFQEQRIERVGFSIEQDLQIVRDLLGDSIGFCEDIQLGVSFLTNESVFGFAATLERYLDLKLDKSMQTSRWSKRPLNEKQLAYAALDVEHLLELWDLIKSELIKKQRFDWYCEERNRVQKLKADDPKRFPGRGKVLLDMGEVGLRLVPLLDRWRNERAERQNIPAGWVLKNNGLFLLCVDEAISDQRLAKVFSANQIPRYRNSIRGLQRRARSKARKSSLVPPRQLSDSVAEICQKCERIAKECSVHDTLLASRKDILFALRIYIAQGRFPAWFGHWRIELIGDLIQQSATKYKLGKLTGNVN